MDGKALMISLVSAVALIALALPHDSMGWLLFVIVIILFVEWVIPAIRAHLNKKRGLLASGKEKEEGWKEGEAKKKEKGKKAKQPKKGRK